MDHKIFQLVSCGKSISDIIYSDLPPFPLIINIPLTTVHISSSKSVTNVSPEYCPRHIMQPCVSFSSQYGTPLDINNSCCAQLTGPDKTLFKIVKLNQSESNNDLR